MLGWRSWSADVSKVEGATVEELAGGVLAGYISTVEGAADEEVESEISVGYVSTVEGATDEELESGISAGRSLSEVTLVSGSLPGEVFPDRLSSGKNFRGKDSAADV